ncbi:hypothetical protein JNG57_02160 [Mycoplasmopsis bovis]|uniref:Uncharacterized protein n=1 Tax=Mycoplasmopsis bovis TaxID=28903 RepID=A0A2N8U2F9_MYCBV|nr:hypothetical protein [Mycoplasmopsis bovis]AFM51812.1 Hypothetical protein Mbov_0455 [Mycoplasmopsis bovis HB0801]AQU85715.1 hypothetical protein B0W43_02295 [Mycoplasmopsis bovis]ATQ40330.1 hypothetical protein B8187_02275 [Mycoplasmopsis bovis]AXJ69247.1 hypothetical protein CH327_02175 [Mycoplasmopsis bovis]AXJ70036.1 hypothetical protein CH328_02360 [Mycoplasmopsis bovis]
MSNPNMHFLKCNKQNIFNMLRSIEYPAIVVDTEFFNKGHHNKCKLPVKLYSKNQKNIVYALSYLIIENKNSFNVKLNNINEYSLTKQKAPQVNLRRFFLRFPV